MVKGPMLHILRMRWVFGISATIGLGLCWSLSYASPTEDGRSAIGPATSRLTAFSSAAMVTEVATGQGPSASLTVESMGFLKAVPSLSKQIVVGGTKLMPYIGAGFGGGYLTEFDRFQHASPSFSSSSGSTSAGLRSLFGQHLIPNEVQLGIRFPF
jgi:hypothetical protein